MLKNLCLILMSFILFTACTFNSKDELFQAQQKGKTVFEDFDIKSYEKYEKTKNIHDDNEGYMSLNFGKWVRHGGDKKRRVDYINYDKPSILEECKSYYENGQIKIYILSFRNRGYFMSKKSFDENKKMTSNIDYDEKYAFSGYDLLELMQMKYKEVDMYSDETRVIRNNLRSVTYEGYQKAKENYESYIEHISMVEGKNIDFYNIESIININKGTRVARIEIVVNAQSGKVMLYGTIDTAKNIEDYYE